MKKIKKLLEKIKNIELSYKNLEVREKIYILASILGIFLVTTALCFNRSAEKKCAEVNSYRGCVAKPALCKTVTTACKKNTSCLQNNTHQCVPFYYF